MNEITLTSNEIDQVKSGRISADLKAQIIDAAREAVACNAPDGGVRYENCVQATDSETDEDYEIRVIWDTTEEWDRAQRAHDIQHILDNELDYYQEDITGLEAELHELEALGVCDATDEANACDWDNPSKIAIQ